MKNNEKIHPLEASEEDLVTRALTFGGSAEGIPGSGVMRLATDAMFFSPRFSPRNR